MRPPMQKPIAAILPLQYGDARSQLHGGPAIVGRLVEVESLSRCQALSAWSNGTTPVNPDRQNTIWAAIAHQPRRA